MTEDNEENRFSRKKSAIKGPVIQDESDSPKPKKPVEAEETQASEAAEQGAPAPVPAPETKPANAGEAVPETPRIKGGKPVLAPVEPEPESKKDKKKREKEEKRKQEQLQRESRRKDKLSKEEKKAQLQIQKESRKKEKLSKSDKKKGKAELSAEAPHAETQEPPAPDITETGTQPVEVPEPVPTDTVKAPVQEMPDKEPVAEEPEENPVAAAQDLGAESISQEQNESEALAEPTSGEEPAERESSPVEGPPVSPATASDEVHEARERRKSRKGRPLEALEVPQEPVETKKDKKKREKEEKRKQELIDRETRKKEVKPKIKGMKKVDPADVRKISEPGMLEKPEVSSLPELAEDTGPAENEEEVENEERVSRFSLKKFVTAYRDRQSVLVRQAEIKRFQSALFPKVMARKWQTAITPSVELPSQGIELPQVPTHMKLGLFFFRNFYAKRQNNEKLETALRKAKMPYSAIQYYSMITIVAILAALGGLLAISVFSLLTGIFIWYAYPALGGIVGLIALMSLNSPSSLVNKRKKDIDSKLPMALAYIATMASADVPVETIMYELGKSYEYGEIAKEARAISASSRLFGNDIVTALREESKYSPSLKFAEFLQGITSTVTSGGNLKDYFTMKAVQFQSELSTVIRANAESVGVLAESYVTVGVAFPLMLLVILGVMAALSPSGSGGLTLVLYMVVLAIIPAITFGFTFLVSSTVKEVDV